MNKLKKALALTLIMSLGLSNAPASAAWSLNPFKWFGGKKQESQSIAKRGWNGMTTAAKAIASGATSLGKSAWNYLPSKAITLGATIVAGLTIGGSWLISRFTGDVAENNDVVEKNDEKAGFEELLEYGEKDTEEPAKAEARSEAEARAEAEAKAAKERAKAIAIEAVEKDVLRKQLKHADYCVISRKPYQIPVKKSYSPERTAKILEYNEIVKKAAPKGSLSKQEMRRSLALRAQILS